MRHVIAKLYIMNINLFSSKLIDYCISDNIKDKRIIVVRMTKNYFDSFIEELNKECIGEHKVSPDKEEQYLFTDGVGLRVEKVGNDEDSKSYNTGLPTVYISNRNTNLISDSVEVILDKEDEDFPIVWIINKF